WVLFDFVPNAKLLQSRSNSKVHQFYKVEAILRCISFPLHSNPISSSVYPHLQKMQEVIPKKEKEEKEAPNDLKKFLSGASSDRVDETVVA
ncbi:hypothetical protein HAX54_010379, partial [Datura stramonium]|nr:hypothetical protein [Datura stramonium]